MFYFETFRIILNPSSVKKSCSEKLIRIFLIQILIRKNSNPDPKKLQVSCRISNPDPVHAHLCCIAEMITIRFTGWISGRIVSFKRIRISKNWFLSETLLSIYRGFRVLEKVTHCTIIHLLSSEAFFQPSVSRVRVCLWCNLCTVV